MPPVLYLHNYCDLLTTSQPFTHVLVQLNRVATPPVPGVPTPPLIPPVPPTVPDPNAALLAAQQRAAMLGLAVPGSLSAAAAAGAAAGAALKAGLPTKAPVLRLDHLGREIDEEGNVVEQKKLPPSELKVRTPLEDRGRPCDRCACLPCVHFLMQEQGLLTDIVGLLSGLAAPLCQSFYPLSLLSPHLYDDPLCPRHCFSKADSRKRARLSLVLLAAPTMLVSHGASFPRLSLPYNQLIAKRSPPLPVQISSVCDAPSPVSCR